MIQQLKTKGFTYDAVNDVLKGEFNGRTSNLYIATNKNKVYRIMVTDAVGTDETNIKIRFNNLCRQFQKNGKYIPQNISGMLGLYEIKEQDDISYEMLVHNKRFQAGYYQISKNDEIDTVALLNLLGEYQILPELAEEELYKKIEDIGDEEAMRLIFNLWDKLTSVMSNRSVWFAISEIYGKYYINIYYDNLLNMSNGEDL